MSRQQVFVRADSGAVGNCGIVQLNKSRQLKFGLTSANKLVTYRVRIQISLLQQLKQVTAILSFRMQSSVRIKGIVDDCLVFTELDSL